MIKDQEGCDTWRETILLEFGQEEGRRLLLESSHTTIQYMFYLQDNEQLFEEMERMMSLVDLEMPHFTPVDYINIYNCIHNVLNHGIIVYYDWSLQLALFLLKAYESKP